MQILVISDIHGNLSALKSVIKDVGKRFSPGGAIILGDLIDYGMRSNEVIALLKKWNIPILCSLWGNHEYAVMMEDYSRFSSQRGVESARRTKRVLSEDSWQYLKSMDGLEGYKELKIEDRKILVVHGTLDDPFWGALQPQSDLAGYKTYDYVLSGHTHIAHAFPYFYQAGNTLYRNRKRTMFINPGSVGQPRNHDPRAQYAILDFERGISLCGVDYDIELEQNLFANDVDQFYKDRLSLGI